MTRRALFVLLFISYAFFYQGGGWNQNSRFALVRAVMNDGTFRIDPYQGNTGDKAFFEGHYYSDKAPGLALAALPVVAPVRALYVWLGGDPETFAGLALLSWLATVLTVGLLTAWVGVLLYDLARDWGASEAGAVFGAITAGLATPLWFMATLFIGHAMSAAGLVAAFCGAYRISVERQRAPDRPIGWSAHPDRRDRRHALFVGVGAGWATVSEFPAAVPAALLAAWTLASAWPLGRRRRIAIATTLMGGALGCAAILMAYQYACFGSPFHIAYSSEQGDFAGMHRGLFGITWPSLSTLYEVLLGEYRGLLPLSPVIALAPFGLWTLRHGAPAVRHAAAVAATIAGFYIWLNASYHYWEGGWSLGPRHLAPALPFLSLGFAPLWDAVSRRGREVMLVAALFSGAQSLIAVSTTVQPPANVSRPFRELIWPAFRDGDLALNTQTFVHHTVDAGRWRTHSDPKAAFNLGDRVGLRGHASLLPLFAIWIVCGLWLWRGLISADRGAGDGT